MNKRLHITWRETMFMIQLCVHSNRRSNISLTLWRRVIVLTEFIRFLVYDLFSATNNDRTFRENIEETFSRYHMQTDICSSFTLQLHHSMLHVSKGLEVQTRIVKDLNLLQTSIRMYYRGSISPGNIYWLLVQDVNHKLVSVSILSI